MQKSVSVELDQMQSKMLGILAKVHRNPGEDLIDWFKKRQRVGREIAVRVGLWSLNWAKRVCDWEDHVTRASHRDSIVARVRDFRGEQWLISHRLDFVSSDYLFGRNRPDAGRLGTRACGGKPQPRWHEGVALSKILLNENSSNSRLSIGNRIRQASSFLASFFNPG